MNRIVTNLSEQEPDTWLQTGLPALYGPHASHPWVSALRMKTKTPFFSTLLEVCPRKLNIPEELGKAHTFLMDKA
jgi:hypothetical protein